MRVGSHHKMLLALVLGGLIVSCSDSPTAPEDSPTALLGSVEGLAPRPVTIDGVFDASEWMNPSTKIEIGLPDGTTTPAWVYVRNDLSNLYVALLFRQELPADYRVAFVIGFFGNGIPPFVEGDDYVIGYVGFNGSESLYDGYYTTFDGSFRGIGDEAFGGTIDGVAAGGSGDGVTVIEISHPLNSGDVGHDISVAPGGYLLTHMYTNVFSPESDAVTTDWYLRYYVSCVSHQGFNGYTWRSDPDCTGE